MRLLRRLRGFLQRKKLTYYWWPISDHMIPYYNSDNEREYMPPLTFSISSTIAGESKVYTMEEDAERMMRDIEWVA